MSPLKNPFIAALLIAGGGLVVIGSALYLNAYFGFDDTGYVTQGQYMAVEAYLRIGPELVMLGVATLIGVGFLLAFRWRSPAETAADADSAADQVWQRGQK